MIVVDPTVLLSALLGSPGAARRLGASDLAAPHAVDADVSRLLAGRLRAGQVTEQRADAALDVLRRLVIDRFEHGPLLPRAWQLRDHLDAGPALCVALAEAVDAPLVTSDARTAAVPGLRTTVEVVPA